jgi:hypothetical protein
MSEIHLCSLLLEHTENWKSKGDGGAYHSIFVLSLILTSNAGKFPTQDTPIYYSQSLFQLKYCLLNLTAQAKIHSEVCSL